MTRRQGMHNEAIVSELEGKFQMGTDMAWLVEFDGHNRVWLPRSQCTLHGDEKRGAKVQVVVPEWLGRRAGIL